MQTRRSREPDAPIPGPTPVRDRRTERFLILTAADGPEDFSSGPPRRVGKHLLGPATMLALGPVSLELRFLLFKLGFLFGR